MRKSPHRVALLSCGLLLSTAMAGAWLGSCSKSGGGDGGNGANGSGGEGGQAGAGDNEGGQGGTDAGEGGAGGENAAGTAGGGGAMAGAGGQAGGPPDGGTTPDAPVARACKGSSQAGTGDGAQVLRTDMTVRKVLDTPNNTVRLARDPMSMKLHLMVEDGTIRRIDEGAAWSHQVVYTPAQIGIATDDKAYGMAFGPDGSLYVVSHITKTKSPASSAATIWQGKPDGSGGRTWRKLAQTESYGRSNTIFDHEWSGIVVSADGKHAFVNAGSRTDHGEELAGARETALTAKIFRLPTDAVETITLKDDLADLKAKGYLYAEGVRNAYDPEFAPNGDLLAGDNGPDADYHEELLFIQQGKHYGFPWRLGNEDNQMQFANYDPISDKRLDPAYTAIKDRLWYKDLSFPAKPANITFVEPIMNMGPDGNQYRDTADGQVKRANIGTFSDHGSPLGLTFDRSGGDLCGAFSGAAFILRHGKAAGDFEDGRDLLLLELSKANGTYTGVKVTQITKHFQGPIDAVLTGSKMFVLDRGAQGRGGKLWEVGLPTGE